MTGQEQILRGEIYRTEECTYCQHLFQSLYSISSTYMFSMLDVQTTHAHHLGLFSCLKG